MTIVARIQCVARNAVQAVKPGQRTAHTGTNWKKMTHDTCPMTDPCLTCLRRPATTRHMCPACYRAVYRRVQRGEEWVEAVEDRVRQLARARRGWTSGLAKAK
jgi:hypothetical protein